MTNIALVRPVPSDAVVVVRPRAKGIDPGVIEASGRQVQGLSLSAPNADKLTLAELIAWRESTAKELSKAVWRDLHADVPALPKSLRGIAGKLDSLAPSLSRAIGLHGLLQPQSSFKGTPVSRASAAGLAAMLTGVAGHLALGDPTLTTLGLVGAGMIAADCSGWLVHRTLDEVFLERHTTAGGPATSGKNFWWHHAYPQEIEHLDLSRLVEPVMPVAYGAVAAGIGGAMLGAGTGWEAFCGGFSLMAVFSIISHYLTHKKNPGPAVRAGRALGLVGTAEHHNLHHYGELKNLLPYETPLRHHRYFQLSMGYVSPAYYLDKLGADEVINKAQYKLTGTVPNSWNEYPNWRTYFLAPLERKPEEMLKARLADYAEHRKWYAEELTAAHNTLAKVATGPEREYAEKYAARLERILATMDAGKAWLENQRDIAIAEREGDDATAEELRKLNVPRPSGVEPPLEDAA